MTATTSMLTRAACLCAMVAGVLIIAQPIHPTEDVSTVSTSTWAVVHYMTVAMAMLALVGLAGIYLRQVSEAGLLGLLTVMGLRRSAHHAAGSRRCSAVRRQLRATKRGRGARLRRRSAL